MKVWIEQCTKVHGKKEVNWEEHSILKQTSLFPQWFQCGMANWERVIQANEGSNTQETWTRGWKKNLSKEGSENVDRDRGILGKYGEENGGADQMTKIAIT